MVKQVSRLRGMTWSHPRGLDPLLASVPSLEELGVAVTWDARSLQGFEEASIERLASEYDLIAIDHPFMGDAFAQGALQPVDSIVGEAFVAELKANSVGPSFESYLWNGRLWAIPVDAAAQVAAFRADLLIGSRPDRAGELGRGPGPCRGTPGWQVRRPAGQSHPHPARLCDGLPCSGDRHERSGRPASRLVAGQRLRSRDGESSAGGHAAAPPGDASHVVGQ